MPATTSSPSSSSRTYRLEPGPVTLYAQLAGILRERVKSGVWPNGAEIPTLEELAAEFNVARVTVRQAMQILMKEGLVSSQRGRRTFVTYTPAEDKNPLFLSINMVSSVTPRYEITIISRDNVPESYLGDPYMGKARGPYMRIRKVDFEGGEPYSVSTHFVSLPIYKRFGKVGEEQVKIARLVRDKSRGALHLCHERVTVDAADLEESQLLKCPLSAPVARIRRVFLDAKGDILYYALLTFRSDRFGIERDTTELIKAG
ncbi:MULTISPECIES: GntR family transcriptional regulator [unclassified Variovorax]|uniref:GntR family transcriptional regulator n=1 Tax=unclassified Variovorax TaxID=663243 RepID=UPI00076D3F7A|nr:MULTISPECIES: GntR family transcriptional regulator [unclassified Variovorax]KWT73934.1 transcriptional regulator, GntR family protein [Variovorax sp. WDL1]PNG52271.1 putative HTH-type transcriptional regulator YurK [Variovorax sp. B4]PNG54811.1 putative HTH-type transcriptional regulator YurK [Variovorax sp. B2]VTV15815.1 putative HTH-type transcriptional regulator YurK [Variovorax sp. WDL1]